MWPYLVAAVAGAAIAWSRRPRTEVRKLELIGGRTGTEYSCEDFPDAGIVVLRAPDGTVASFQRLNPKERSIELPNKRFRFLRGIGLKPTMQGMALDLGAIENA